MSEATLRTAGILLVAVVTIEFGGVSLLRFVRDRNPYYTEHPVRRALFRAGHAHAGVLVVLALAVLPYLDAAALSGGLRTLARWAIVAAPILMPLGFFLSVAKPSAQRPNGLLALTYLGGASLAVGTLLLGVGLLRA